MEVLTHFISYTKKLIWRARPKPAKNPPETLSGEIMESVMREARFLRSGHDVDVRALEPDEIPTIPKRADK